MQVWDIKIWKKMLLDRIFVFFYTSIKKKKTIKKDHLHMGGEEFGEKK